MSFTRLTLKTGNVVILDSRAGSEYERSLCPRDKAEVWRQHERGEAKRGEGLSKRVEVFERIGLKLSD